MRCLIDTEYSTYILAAYTLISSYISAANRQYANLLKTDLDCESRQTLVSQRVPATRANTVKMDESHSQLDLAATGLKRSEFRLVDTGLPYRDRPIQCPMTASSMMEQGNKHFDANR